MTQSNDLVRTELSEPCVLTMDFVRKLMSLTKRDREDFHELVKTTARSIVQEAEFKKLVVAHEKLETEMSALLRMWMMRHTTTAPQVSSTNPTPPTSEQGQHGDAENVALKRGQEDDSKLPSVKAHTTIAFEVPSTPSTPPTLKKGQKYMIRRPGIPEGDVFYGSDAVLVDPVHTVGTMYVKAPYNPAPRALVRTSSLMDVTDPSAPKSRVLPLFYLESESRLPEVTETTDFVAHRDASMAEHNAHHAKQFSARHVANVAEMKGLIAAKLPVPDSLRRAAENKSLLRLDLSSSIPDKGRLKRTRDNADAPNEPQAEFRAKKHKSIPSPIDAALDARPKQTSSSQNPKNKTGSFLIANPKALSKRRKTKASGRK